MFNISAPLDGKKASFVSKLEPLSDEFRQKFKIYWKRGTYLVVDESIREFWAVPAQLSTFFQSLCLNASRFRC